MVKQGKERWGDGSASMGMARVVEWRVGFRLEICAQAYGVVRMYLGVGLGFSGYYLMEKLVCGIFC